MPRESKELRELRESTPFEPAPMPEEAGPMKCPACGSKLLAAGCTNEACEEFGAF